MEPLDVIALAGEVIAWVALSAGGVLLLAFAFARMADGAWDAIEVAVVERDDGTVVRWFAGGEFHERPLEPGEEPKPDSEDGEPLAWVRRRSPDRLRFEATSHVPRVLGTIAVILVGLGIVATVASTVAGVVG
ncbi:hypothetical protein [Agromyces bracchium]|uniref:Sortase n=1 Tax=Agromyces bracchium TaxID=88376 RepID=A0A6I3M3B5_9MICO|nr:hypothetical protein [Agromyces bracchium]MTH67341.1 hypothetical protein [Agromyces bracchium]